MNTIIESIYQSFLKKNTVASDPFNIDFIGINIDGASISLKGYLNRKNSALDHSDIVSAMTGRDMIRYYESVLETGLLPDYRVDIALKNRSNQNMVFFLDVLRQRSALFTKNEKLIIKLASLKITDLPDFDYASLYFFGYKRTGNLLHSLKFHFYTKWCHNPEYPHMGGFYRDEEYLEKLKAVNIPEIHIIMPIVEKILRIGSGHLWMIGLDTENIGNKYKIYVKNPCDDVCLMAQVIGQTIGIDISPAFEWLKNHEEYCYIGIAICVGVTGEFSVNVYFTPNSFADDTNEF